MKATRQEKPQPFIPVVLTLETQEEVDSLFALMNHSLIRAKAGLPETAHQTLLNFRSSKAHSLHVELQSLIK